jgi:hypothetical protein
MTVPASSRGAPGASLTAPAAVLPAQLVRTSSRFNLIDMHCSISWDVVESICRYTHSITAPETTDGYVDMWCSVACTAVT